MRIHPSSPTGPVRFGWLDLERERENLSCWVPFSISHALFRWKHTHHTTPHHHQSNSHSWERGTGRLSRLTVAFRPLRHDHLRHGRAKKIEPKSFSTFWTLAARANVKLAIRLFFFPRSSNSLKRPWLSASPDFVYSIVQYSIYDLNLLKGEKGYPA